MITERANIQLIHGDCMEAMKQMPDNSVDLIITSPPYNMGGGKSLGYQPNSSVGQSFYGDYDDNKDDKDYVDWCMKIIKECLRISRYVLWNGKRMGIYFYAWTR